MESFFVIETLACSTKLTQNPSLLGLLKWRHNPNSVQQTVKHITYVNGEEVVKFLTDIFDAVFAILAQPVNPWVGSEWQMYNGAACTRAWRLAV